MNDETAIEKKQGRGQHPAFVAQRWQPGQSGNPRGRPRGVTFVGDWINSFLICDDAGEPKYRKADLQKITEDDKAAPAAVIAARRILRAMQNGESWVTGKNGELRPARLDPEPRLEAELIMDRLEGRPHQSVHVTTEKVSRPADLAADAIALLRSDPRLIRPLWPRLLSMTRVAPTIRDQLRPLLQQHAPDLVAALDVVDTVATEVAEPVTDVPGVMPSLSEQEEILSKNIRQAAQANEPVVGVSHPVPAPPFPDTPEPIERSGLPYTPPQEGRRIGG